MPQPSRRSVLAAGALLGAAIAARPLHAAAAAGTDADAAAIALPPEIEIRVNALLARYRLPALGLAAVHRGAPVAICGFGTASLPFSAPADERTLFQIGSVGKHFTAAAVLALVERGKIVLARPIGDYVKDLPATFARRSVQSLLTHTAGVPDYETLPEFPPDRPLPQAALLPVLARLGPDFAEGTAWSYSNSGYVLLGYLIAAVTGGTYADAMQALLLDPARLRDARVDNASAVIRGRAEPYLLQDGVLHHAPQMDGAYSGSADGGMLVSPRDAARWDVAFWDRGLLNEASRTAMRTPALLSNGRNAAYGMGWSIDRVHGRRIEYHGGSVPGFLAFYLRVPDERLAVAVMTNVESPQARVALRQIAQEVAEHIVPDSSMLSLAKIEDGDPPKTVRARSLLQRGNNALDPAAFAPELAALIARKAVGAALPPNRATLGQPASFELVERFDEPGGSVRRYRAVYADRTEHTAFAEMPDGRIYRVTTV